jgi:hypothetical protein
VIRYQNQHHCQHNQWGRASNRTLSTIHHQFITITVYSTRHNGSLLSKPVFEKSRVCSLDEHRETGVDPHHRVRTFDTNGAHKGYTTNDFTDRVIVHEIGETTSRGARVPFWSCNTLRTRRV